MPATRVDERTAGVREWVVLGLLSLFWGSSFVFIKFALDDFHPWTLTAVRTSIGATVLLAWMRSQSIPLPRQRGFWARALFLGVVSFTCPFFFITWGQQWIDTGIAAILNSTAPLFLLLMVPVFHPQERMPPIQTAAVVLGFVGVLVLMLDRGMTGSLIGKLSVIAGTMCYAVSAIFLNRVFKVTHFVAVATAAVLISTLVAWPVALAVATPTFSDISVRSWIAVLWLGVLSTSIGYVMYVHLNRSWGATRSSMVTYLIPPTAVALGAIIRHEPITPALIVGGVLIAIGVLGANQRRAPVEEGT